MSGTKSVASSALLMARAKGAPVGRPFSSHQPLDGVGPAGAGAEAVDGFGRKRDQLPFGQRLNGTMNDVASILGVTNIDDDRRHGQMVLSHTAGGLWPPSPTSRWPGWTRSTRGKRRSGAVRPRCPAAVRFAL